MSKTQTRTIIEVPFYSLLLSKRGVSSLASLSPYTTMIIARKEPNTKHTEKIKGKLI